MSNKFIDISEHNTILSFGGLVESNLKGVIMKASEGTTYYDHALEINYEALHGKIAIGFYHYLISTSAPQTQAQNFWNLIKNKEYDIIPVLDVEQDSLGDNAESFSEQFLQEFRNLSGQEMLIYSGRCYIEEHFSNEFKQNNIWWVADYSANETPTISGCKIIAWQYTEDCRSYAFTLGDLDCNILVDESHFFLSDFVPFADTQQNSTSTNDIATLQNELIVQGFTDKNGNELIIDGVAGELTLSACPTIKLGSRGNITAWVQRQLEISADGIFGEMTRQAVITFQENMSLNGDGIVGKMTWRKLLGL